MILFQAYRDGVVWLEGHLSLKHFPLRIVRGDLTIWSCPALISMPNDLTVDGVLDIRLCGSLRALPQTLRVYGHMVLEDCAVENLPQNLLVWRDLYVGKTRIRSVPNNAVVCGGRFVELTPSQGS